MLAVDLHLHLRGYGVTRFRIVTDLEVGLDRLARPRCAGQQYGNRTVVLILGLVITGGPAGPRVVACDLPILVLEPTEGRAVAAAQALEYSRTAARVVGLCIIFSFGL
jgi:hypothetical protein